MIATLRVLLVEDNPDDAELVLMELDLAGFAVESRRVETAERLADALENDPWDVLISDFNLPAFSALEALAVLQRSGRDIPAIVVSGCVGEETAVAVMKAGAHDFIVKGQYSRLVPAIRRELNEAAGRLERRRLEAANRAGQELLSKIMASLGEGILVIGRDGCLLRMNPEAERLLGWREDELIGRPVHPLIHCCRADGSALPEEKCTVRLETLAGRRVASEDDVYVRRDGTRFPVAYVATPVFENGKVAASVVAFQDITRRRRDEEALRLSEERFRAIATNLPGMVFQLFRHIDGALQASYVSDGAQPICGLTPTEVLDDFGRFTALIEPEDALGFHASLAASAYALTPWNWEGRLRTDDVKWVNARATVRRLSPDVVQWDGVMLNITASKRYEQELQESRGMLRMLSAHREEVREAERTRIAREIHDELGQILTALRMDISLLRINFGQGNSALMERVQSMRELVDKTIHVVRHVASSLRPGALDLGIGLAVEWLAQDFEKRMGVACRLEIEEPVALDDSRATAVFRILQESLTNVARHAAANQVRIRLSCRDDHLVLSVQDDGRGFDPHKAKGGSFGLVGIKERALMLGGQVDIASSPRGTTLTVTIPLTTPSEEPT